MSIKFPQAPQNLAIDIAQTGIDVIMATHGTFLLFPAFVFTTLTFNLILISSSSKILWCYLLHVSTIKKKVDLKYIILQT